MLVFAHDGRTLYFRSGQHLFAASINLNPPGAGGAAATAGGRGGGRGGRGAAPADTPEPTAGTANTWSNNTADSRNLIGLL